MSDAPSAFKIEMALAAWNSARSSLLAGDAELSLDENAIQELLGPAEADVDTILTRLMQATRHADAMANAAKEEIQALQMRKARYEQRSTIARQTTFSVMQAIERNKFEAAGGTWSIRPAQQSVVVTDVEQVPDIYVRIERVPDKQTILSALKSGLTVAGCELSNGLPALSLRKK